MCEILAPAGDEAAFYAAVHAGADAVYLGLTDFSARKSAANFSAENLKKYTAYAHVLGVRVYVALNTLVKDGELERFFACARQAWVGGADALIIQDVFLGKLLKETYPEMVLHLSTQAGVCNVYGARLAKRCGFSRVILARETPLAGIAAIAREIETEVFVQGALCTCFSGQCYLSAFIGGNSGNRGFCKQPCRKRCRIDRQGFETPAYRLSLADLCMGEDVGKLAAAGVSSFKIEGRMRSAAYVGAAVGYYRRILAGEDALEAFSCLKRAYNRGDYTKGYAFGQDKDLISSQLQGHKGEKIGSLSKERRGKFVLVRSAFRPADGDGFKIIRGGRELSGGAYSASFPAAKGGFYLPYKDGYREGDGVYLTADTALAARVSAQRRAAPLSLEVFAKEGEPLRAKAVGAFGKEEFASAFCLERAKTSALTKEELQECFSKTDAYPFSVTVKAEVSGAPFAARSQCNAFRREVYERLYERGSRPPLAARAPRPLGKEPCAGGWERAAIGELAAFAEAAERAGLFIFSPRDYKDGEEFDRFFAAAAGKKCEVCLYLPAFMTDADIAAAEKNILRFGMVYAEGAWAAEYCRARGLRLFAGTGFNIFNRFSAQMLGEESACAAYALSKELSLKEGEGMCGFRLAGGAVKVMELGHCPFGRRCASCDRRARYTLTDEEGRAFPLRRYESGVCRFELFNCAKLVPVCVGRALYDLRTLNEEERRAALGGVREAGATQGLSASGVR